MPVTRQEFRDAMARLGAAVNVVTTAGPGGRAGFTASAVCSVTDEPAMLLVCLNRSSSVNAAFKANGVLCVNTLRAGQREVAALFASSRGGVPMEERFAARGWTTLATGAPVLEDAAVSFDCRIAEAVEKGTHGVLFAAIEAVRQGPVGDALIYFGRGYHGVGAAA